MPLKYQSGDVICKGDRILMGGNPGVVEFVADPLVKDPETDWYVQEFSSGVMIVVPEKFGHMFLSDTENEEDLIFVSRAIEANSNAKI